MQHRALRFSIPINALLVECNEMPLDLSHTKLPLSYWLRLEDEINLVIKNSWEYEKHVNSFGWNVCIRKSKNMEFKGKK